MCGSAAHKFLPHPARAVLYCEFCGDIRGLTVAIAPTLPPLALEPSRAAATATAYTPPPFTNADDLEKTVQELEADVLARIREARLDPAQALAAGGIDPSSSFAQRLMEQAAKPDPRKAEFIDVEAARQMPLWNQVRNASALDRTRSWQDHDVEIPPARGRVDRLTADEQALIDQTNAEPQTPRVTVDSDTLEAGL